MNPAQERAYAVSASHITGAMENYQPAVIVHMNPAQERAYAVSALHITGAMENYQPATSLMM